MNREAQAPGARVVWNSLFNWGGVGLEGATRLLLVPFMLWRLGGEQYGLWIIALTISAWCASVLDLGICYSVIHEVSASGTESRRAEFVRAARIVYLTAGVVGTAILAGCGVCITHFVPLSHVASTLALPAFLLVALTFPSAQLFAYESSILQGLQRFDLFNALSVSCSLIGALGIVVVLLCGGGLIGVAVVNGAAMSGFAVMAHATVVRTTPAFRYRTGRLEWRTVWAKTRFGIASQILNAATDLLWNSGPLLVAPILGSAAVALLQVGRKFPWLVTRLAWAAGITLFPAASETAGDKGNQLRLILEAGSRWLTVCATPLCVILMLLAPGILYVWAGVTSPDVVMLLRLLTLTALFEAISAAPYNVLWGRGELRMLLWIMCPVGIGGAALTLCLLKPCGLAGAGLGVVLPSLLMTIAVLWQSARICHVAITEFVRQMLRGLWMSVLAAVVTIAALGHIFDGSTLPGLLVMATCSTLAFGLTFYCYGATETERVMVGSAFRAVRRALVGEQGSFRVVPGTNRV